MRDKGVLAVVCGLLALPLGSGQATAADLVDEITPSVSKTVVINEVAAGEDQYVELHNISDSTVDLGGWMIEPCGPGGSARPIQIPEGTFLTGDGFYLIAGPDFDGTGVDLIVTDGMSNNGAALLDAGSRRVDGVSFTRRTCGEGRPALRCPSGAASRDSNGTDTDDNAADFRCRTRTPSSANA